MKEKKYYKRINNMNKSAKEMFEDLGYKLYEETDKWVTYRKYPDTIIDDNTYQEIFFNFCEQFFVIVEYHRGKLEEKFITTKELRAINKLIEYYEVVR